jgi:hypothetical protein
LELKVGIAEMDITKKELEEAFEKYGSKFEGCLEDYFALLYLSKEFDRLPEDIHLQVAFRGNDYGIDAYFIDVNRQNLYLYQFKWSEDHKLFQESFERLISKGMERVFGSPVQDQKQNQLLLQLKSSLNENKSVIAHVLIRFIFNGDPSIAEQSQVLDSLREDLESKKYLIDNYFGRQIDMTFQFLSNKTRKLAGLSYSKKTHQFDIVLNESMPYKTDKGEQMLIGFIPIHDLYSMYREMGNRFFERNIRSGLLAEKSPNRAMRRAFKEIVDEKANHEVFCFNHNGVTLAAEHLILGNGRLTIVEPRLLNGAQTVTSYAKFLKDNEGNPALEKNEKALKSIRVIAKMIWDASPDFITNVTVSNNKQNPVLPWNLRANDKIQLQLQEKLANDLGIYYERQEEAFDNMTDEDLEAVGVDPTQGKPIQITKLAQTFLAMQGELDRMSRMPDVFENLKFYDDTFRASYLTDNARHILLAYKIHFRLNRIIWAIEEKGENKYFYITRAKNLIWALLIQGILNSPNLDELSDRFGTKIVMETDFTDLLKKLASSKVRFIISEAVVDTSSQEMISKEKYSFLRTKSIYYRCMEIALKKYGWKKKSF